MFITGFLVSPSKMGIAALVHVAEGRASMKALPGRRREGNMRCADPCCCCWDLYGQVCSAFHFQQRDLMSSCCMVFIILHLHNCVIRFSQWTILFGVIYFLQINYQEILLLSHVGVWHLAGPPWVQREHVNAWYITDIGA